MVDGILHARDIPSSRTVLLTQLDSHWDEGRVTKAKTHVGERPSLLHTGEGRRHGAAPDKIGVHSYSSLSPAYELPTLRPPRLGHRAPIPTLAAPSIAPVNNQLLPAWMGLKNHGNAGDGAKQYHMTHDTK